MNLNQSFEILSYSEYMVIFVNYLALPYHKPTKVFHNRGKKCQNAPSPLHFNH